MSRAGGAVRIHRSIARHTRYPYIPANDHLQIAHFQINLYNRLYQAGNYQTGFHIKP